MQGIQTAPTGPRVVAIAAATGLGAIVLAGLALAIARSGGQWRAARLLFW